MDKGSRKLQYLVTFCVSLAFVVFGAISAWSSPVIPKFKRNETDVDIDDSGVSWMVSTKPIGFIAGSFICRYTMDKLGRRATILYSAFPVGIASIIVAFGIKDWMLIIAMFLWNCGTGMISTVNGIYFAETSDKDIRATLLLCTRISFNFGTFLIMSVGPLLSYTTLNFLLLPLPFVYFAACCWIPESPYYLLKMGKVDMARKELQRLFAYKNEETLDNELSLIQSGVKNEMTKSSTTKELFTGKQYRRAIIVSVGIKFTQIMTGGGTIRDYLGVIMQESNVAKEYEKTVFTIFGVVIFAMTIISTIFVDRVGRRPLFITSYIGTGLSLAAIGIYFFLLNVTKVDHTTLSTYGFIPFLGIIMSNVISSFGFIALCTVVPAELFPINIKAVAMTSLSVYGGVLGFLVGKGYQNVKDLLGIHTVFWIFGGVAFFGAVFTYFIVPETKGKTLNEIQVELQEDAYIDGAVKLNKVSEDGECEGTELEVLQTEKSK